MRTIQSGFRLAAFTALGLAGVAVAACGSPASADQASQSVDQQPMDPTQASPNPQGTQGASCGGQGSITDCSVGQILSIAHAMVKADEDAANLALQKSQDSAVKQYARRELQEDKKLDQKLSSYEERSNVQASGGDIDAALTRHAHAELQALRSSPNFDRDYVADSIAGKMKALGFIDLVQEAVQQKTGGQGQMGQPQGMGGAYGAQGVGYPGVGSQGPSNIGIGNPAFGVGPGPGVGTPGYGIGGQGAGIAGQAPGYPGAGMGNVGYPGGQGVMGTQGGVQGSEQQSNPQELLSTLQNARQQIESDLQSLFGLESQLVGACGASTQGACAGGGMDAGPANVSSTPNANPNPNPSQQ